MAKNKVIFDDTNYSVEDESLAAATVELQSHLSTVMNGSGAVINLGGNSYNIDSTKLSSATNTFVNHLGTVAGNGLNVVVGGVKYSVDSAKMSNAFSEIHAVLGGLHSDDEGSTPQDGNTYEYGDYIYRRRLISGNPFGAKTLEEARELCKQMELSDSEDGTTWEELLAEYNVSEEEFFSWFDLTEEYFEPSVFANEWEVSINDAITDYDQTTYGAILESINGEPVTSMAYTFSDCTSLTTAPVIPSSVTTMESTFRNCTSLTTAPVIPSGVTNMGGTFGYCTSLTTAPVIPSGVTSMDATFTNCTSLTTAPVIPSGVTSMSTTFNRCYSLKTYVGSTAPDGDFSDYVIPRGVTNMGTAFCDCTSLTIAPKIPNGVTELYWTFRGCTSLTSSPEIPSSVTIMSETFAYCTSLTTKPIIPSSVLTPENYIFTGCTQFGY